MFTTYGPGLEAELAYRRERLLSSRPAPWGRGWLGHLRRADQTAPIAAPAVRVRSAERPTEARQAA